MWCQYGPASTAAWLTLVPATASPWHTYPEDPQTDSLERLHKSGTKATTHSPFEPSPALPDHVVQSGKSKRPSSAGHLIRLLLDGRILRLTVHARRAILQAVHQNVGAGPCHGSGEIGRLPPSPSSFHPAGTSDHSGAQRTPSSCIAPRIPRSAPHSVKLPATSRSSLLAKTSLVQPGVSIVARQLSSG